MSANEDRDIDLSKRAMSRSLHVEGLENRNLLAADFDDAMGEAQPMGPATEQGSEVAAEISVDMDVDMYSLAIGSGQTVDIDVDTPTNGAEGLGAYMRLFNDQGVQVAANNDAAAPGENTIGFDPYLRFTAGQGGIFVIGISGHQNTSYNPLTGEGDQSTEQFATGGYTLRVNALPEFPMAGNQAAPPVESTLVTDNNLQAGNNQGLMGSMDTTGMSTGSDSMSGLGSNQDPGFDNDVSTVSPTFGSSGMMTASQPEGEGASNGTAADAGSAQATDQAFVEQRLWGSPW